MIGNVRIDKRKDVKESKRWKQCSREQQKGCKRPAILTNEQYEAGGERDHAQRKQVLPDLSGVDFPVRVVESQVDGSDQLTQIKPYRSASDKHALNRRESEVRSLRAHVSPFHPCREKAGRDARRKPRHQRKNVALQFQLSTLPPQNHEQGSRQSGRHGLC